MARWMDEIVIIEKIFLGGKHRDVLKVKIAANDGIRYVNWLDIQPF